MVFDTRKKPLLFKEYPNLEAGIPWKELGKYPTQVKRLTELQKELKCKSLWFKHDEENSPIYGGNKVRKFEFIFAEILAKGCKQVMTMGGIGSNHIVANTVFCRHLGLKSISAMVDQPLTPIVRENLLLELAFGSDIVYAHTFKGLLPRMIWEYIKRKKIYFIWHGGTVPLGTLGFVNAVLELKIQIENNEIPEPDHLFVACSSLGTAAGFLLGAELFGLKTQIHAVQVGHPKYANAKSLKNHSRKTWKFMRKYDKTIPDTIRLDQLTFDEKQFGGQYGRPTPAGLEACLLIKEKEGITLEHAYTGKTFASLCDFVRKNPAARDQTILFWNTMNTRNFSDIFVNTDYHGLPEKLHWVFETPLPDFGLRAQYSRYCRNFDLKNRL